jgi:hypothetical protein
MNKGSGSFMVLITSAIILIVGYGVYMSIASSIDGTDAYNNATAASTNTVYGIVPLIIIVIAILSVIGLINWYISSAENYQKTHKWIIKILFFMDKTTYYFAFGLLSYAIFSTVAFSVYLMIRLFTTPGAGEISFTIVKWILIIITFFFVTAGVGYVFEKKIWIKWKERKEEQKRLNLMNELPTVNNYEME